MVREKDDFAFAGSFDQGQVPAGLGRTTLCDELRHVRCDSERIVVVVTRVHGEEHPVIILIGLNL